MIRHIIAVQLLLSALTATAKAVEFPALPDIIPSPIARARPDLVRLHGPLKQERAAMLAKGAAFDRACGRVEVGSAQDAQCNREFPVLSREAEQHHRKSVEFIEAYGHALAAERARLQEQDKILTQNIERDLNAVRNLGFDRRAQDFEEWEKLATDAKRAFEDTVRAEAAGLIASKAKNGILAGVKSLDKVKVSGWIAALTKQDPPPTEIIALLQRMASVTDADRVRLVTDAKYLAKLIENVAKTAKVSGWKDGLPVLLEIACEAFPSEATQCQWFKATASVTVASLYNNAARRIASNEVDRLTGLTEAQLRVLPKLNELIVGHVRDRNDVRAQLKALN
jgi:ribonuclease HI